MVAMTGGGAVVMEFMEKEERGRDDVLLLEGG